MKKDHYTISELKGCSVYEERDLGKRIGKVHSFAFHPRKRSVVGFTVKRPDIALMMHRPELFVALDSFDVVEGKVVIAVGKGSTGSAACKRLGVDWDACVMWQGLPLLTEDEQRVGFVGDVKFRTSDGAVESLFADRGASADLLLGLTELPAGCIEGFKTGVGDPLGVDDGDDFLRGAIIVSPDALEAVSTGGLAEKAGAASAVAADKASKAVQKVKPVASEAARKVKPAAGEAARKAEDAVNKGAFAVGRQLSRTKGMFASFKEEYRRALSDGDGEPDER